MAIDNSINNIPITINNIFKILDNCRPELEFEFTLLTVADVFVLLRLG